MSDGNNQHEVEQNNVNIHRRRLIESIGTASIVGLAGCGGGGDGGDGDGGDGGQQTTEPQTEEGVQVVDIAYRMPDGGNFNKLQWNYASTAPKDNWNTARWAFEWFITLNAKTQEIRDNLASVTVDGDTMTIEMQEEYTWHNGDPVTADDIVTQMKIAKLMGSSRRIGNAKGIVDSVQKTGERTIEISMPAELNPTVSKQQLFAGGNAFNTILCMPEAVFGKFAESMDDATSEDAKKEVRTNVNEFQWEFEDAYGSGPFEMTENTGNEIILERFDDHPQSENVNFARARIDNIPQEQQFPATRSNNLDAGGGSPDEAAIKTLGDNWIVRRISGFGGQAVITNHQHPMFGRSNIKKAVAHIIDNKQVSNVMGSGKTNPVKSTLEGFVKSNRKAYMGSPIEGDLTVYDSKERAAALLKEEGFTREDGKWYDPDGERWTFNVSTFDNPSWNAATRTVVSQLQSFGIDAQENIIPAGTFFSKYPNGGYDFVVEYGNSTGSPNPYFGYNRNMVGFGGGSMQYPDEVEAPPVGEPDGSLQTYVIQDALNEALRAPSEEAFTKALRKLAWIQNQTLPVIPLVTGTGATLFNKNRFEWPSGVDPYWWQAGPGQDAFMSRNGMMQAKQQ